MKTPIFMNLAATVAEAFNYDRFGRAPNINLKLIALDLITFDDVWDCRPDHDLEHYLCPRLYHIGFPVNITGQRQLMLTQIAQGTARSAEEYSSDLRIFEPYWRY